MKKGIIVATVVLLWLYPQEGIGEFIFS